MICRLVGSLHFYFLACFCITFSLEIIGKIARPIEAQGATTESMRVRLLVAFA